MTIAHLAKTLALLGNLAQAEVEMKKWGQWAKVQRGREQTRWKEASVKLELFKGGSLNPKQWQAARNLGLKKREVENLYKLYAADFEMFGYSAAEYINVAQPD